MRQETIGAISALLTADPTINERHRKSVLSLIVGGGLEREVKREPLVSYAEAASQLAVSRKRIQQLVSQGKLAGVCLGSSRHTRVTLSSVEKLISSQSKEAEV